MKEVKEPIENKGENITTWAAKVPQELKNKISNIIKEENITSKEFLNNIIELYEIEELKKNSGMEKDIVDFENNLARVFDLFKGAINRNNSLESNIKNKYDKMITEKDEEIKRMKEVLNEKENEIKEKDKRSKEDLELLKNKDKELLKINKDKDRFDELVENYKKQIDDLNKKLEGFNEIENEYQNILKKNQFLKESIENSNKEILSLNASITNLRNNYKNENQTLELQKAKEILEIKGQYQDLLISQKSNADKELKECNDLILELKEKLMKSNVEREYLKEELEKTRNILEEVNKSR